MIVLVVFPRDRRTCGHLANVRRPSYIPLEVGVTNICTMSQCMHDVTMYARCHKVTMYAQCPPRVPGGVYVTANNSWMGCDATDFCMASDMGFLLLPGLLGGEKPALVKGPHAVVEGHVPQAVLPQHVDEAIVFNARTGQDTRDAAV